MLPEYFPWKTCSYIRVPYFLLYVCVTRKKFLIPLPSHTVQMFRFLLNTLKFSHKLHVYIKTLWYNKLQFCYVFTASVLLFYPPGPYPLPAVSGLCLIWVLADGGKCRIQISWHYLPKSVSYYHVHSLWKCRKPFTISSLSLHFNILMKFCLRYRVQFHIYCSN